MPQGTMQQLGTQERMYRDALTYSYAQGEKKGKIIKKSSHKKYIYLKRNNNYPKSTHMLSMHMEHIQEAIATDGSTRGEGKR